MDNFEWDPDKRQAKIEKHGIDFVWVNEVVGCPCLRNRSDRHVQKLWTATGRAEGPCITVAYEIREERIRIISARSARSYERKGYHKAITGRRQ